MDNRRMKAILLFVAALAFASAPLWSSGFGGFDPNRYPDPQVDPPVQPAGYAFSIWGPIYLWLVVSAGYGLLARADDAAWDHPRWPLIVSLAIGTSWISVAQESPVWATALILVMLAGAITAFLRTPPHDRWLLAGPVGLYAGWLTAASFVSLALLGGGYDILVSDTAWAWIAVVATLLSAWAIQSRALHAPEYGLAVAWAFAAVAVTNWDSNRMLAFAGIGAAVLVGGMAILRWRRR
jgi:hypothetical protein